MRAKESMRRAVLVACISLWAVAVIVYSLIQKRPPLSIKTEIAQGIAAAVIAAGIAALTIEWTRDRKRALSGIVMTMIGAAVIVELLQRRYGDVLRSEPLDVAYVAAGSVAAVVLVSLLRKVTSGPGTQWVVALVLVVSGTLVTFGSIRQSDRAALYLACESFWASPSQSPLVSISTSQGTTLARSGQSSVKLETRDGGADYLEFAGGSGVEYQDTNNLVCGLAGGNSLYASVEVRSGDLAQKGPARILTLSTGVDYNQILFHVGQEGGSLSVRLRTEEDSYENFLFPGYFVDLDWHLVEIELVNSQLTVLKDGTVFSTASVAHSTLSGWQVDWSLMLGNEVTDDRPFVGDIGQTTVESHRPSDG